MGRDGDRDEFDLGGALRRIRRTADLSQRQLAESLGLSAATIGHAEAGRRAVPLSALARAASLAGLRLALVDAQGAPVEPMTRTSVRDRAGRRFPAHLDTRHGDEDWWHGPERYSRRAPDWTFDGRHRRDWRRRNGIPDDHHQPGPGDSLAERAEERRRRAEQARRDRPARAARPHAGQQDPLHQEPDCTCPRACDALLWAGEVVVPHVRGCSCRCDVA